MSSAATASSDAHGNHAQPRFRIDLTVPPFPQPATSKPDCVQRFTYSNTGSSYTFNLPLPPPPPNSHTNSAQYGTTPPHVPGADAISPYVAADNIEASPSPPTDTSVLASTYASPAESSHNRHDAFNASAPKTFVTNLVCPPNPGVHGMASQLPRSMGTGFDLSAPLLSPACGFAMSSGLASTSPRSSLATLADAATIASSSSPNASSSTFAFAPSPSSLKIEPTSNSVITASTSRPPSSSSSPSPSHPESNPRSEDATVASTSGSTNTASVKKCSHCEATITPMWRRHPNTLEPLCNACGLYLQARKQLRPRRLIEDDGSPNSDSANGTHSGGGKECSHCLTRFTSAWRRGKEGEQLCNACGVYLKLRGVQRPLELRVDKVKRRAHHGEAK